MPEVFGQLDCVHQYLLPVKWVSDAVAVGAVTAIAGLAGSFGPRRLPVALIAQEWVWNHLDQFKLDKVLLHKLGIQDLFASRSALRIDTQQFANHVVEVIAVLDWYARELAFLHLLEETVHVLGSERGNESAHLVADAAEGPDITFGIVWLVLPYLGTGVVWSACLCIQ